MNSKLKVKVSLSGSGSFNDYIMKYSSRHHSIKTNFSDLLNI